MLQNEMLPAIRSIAGELFIFQQDSAPAHSACETVALLAQETPRFIGPDLRPSNSPDLNPVNYKFWGLLQEHVYKSPFKDMSELKQRLVEAWSAMPQCVILLTRPSTSGVDAFTVVYRPKADTSNTSYDTYGIVNLNGFVQPVRFYH